MHISSFLSLVEIRTKLASMVPFLLGTAYAVYHFQQFELINFMILFVSIITFDMVTTALNNYFDFKRANKKHGYNYERHNAIINYKLKESTVIIVIIVLLAIATISGIILFLNTDIILLLVGMASFAIGICYSFGPIPISRTPLGEIFSGFFMGFVIVFVSAYVHIYDRNIVSIIFENGIATLRMDIMEVIYVFLISIPLICGIANIMLANNICDTEDDMENNRYTLPIYIGKKNALLLFSGLYGIAYADIIMLCILRIIPLYALIILLTVVPVYKDIKRFYGLQTKKDTFPLSVKNFMMMGIAEVAVLGIAAIVSIV